MFIGAAPAYPVPSACPKALQSTKTANFSTNTLPRVLIGSAIYKQGPNANHIPLPTSSSPIYFYLKKSRQIFPQVDNFKIL